MINIMYGHRGCGKSQMIECYMKDIKNKVYFGTLPPSFVFQETICKHKIRRGDFWIELETSNYLSNDLERLRQVVNNSPENTWILIDGLTNWFYFAKDLISDTFIYRVLNCLFDCVSKTTNVEVFLIDTYPEDFESDVFAWRISCILYNYFCSSSFDFTYIDFLMKGL